MKVQSKKYSKYLTGVASAALVASAVAPVVSAADFNDVNKDSSHKEAIDALSKAQIITGYPDGSFKPSRTLTRSDVVKLMGKWLVSKGYEIPKDYQTNLRFKDMTGKSDVELLKYAAIVKDNNVFKGYEDGTLNAAGNITRENMALVLVRAYDAVNNTDLVSYVKGQEFNKDVVDIAKAKEESHPYIDVLDYFDITNPEAPNFRPKETTTRAQFASFLYKTSNVVKPEVEEPVIAEVTSVEAISDSAIELKGTNLQVLKAEQISIEGNEPVSYKVNSDGTKATVELKNELVSGKEVNLTINSSKPELDMSFKFTYEMKVETVTAGTAIVNAATGGQMLSFLINNDPVDYDKLKAAGYTVEFQTTKNGILIDKATGELNPTSLLINTDFSYKVIVTKGDQKFESDLKKVEVVDYKEYISSLDEVTVKQGEVAAESGKLAIDQAGDVFVKAVKGTAADGKVVDNPTSTYTSSNPSVATVNAATGKVELISTGQTDIIVKSGSASKTIPLTVVAGERKATAVTTESNSLNVLANKNTIVDVVVKDQFNDLYTGSLTIESKDENIAKATISSSDEGKSKVNVESLKTGTTDLSIKSGDKVLLTMTVNVSNDEKTATRKLETISKSDDLQLDVMKGSTDNSVKLAWKQFNEQGFYIGNENVSNGSYTATSSNDNIATVSFEGENNEIIVKGIKEGTATIIIKEGSVTRATAEVKVVDTTPSISAVKFEKTEPVTKVGDFIQSVIKEEGISLTSKEHSAKISKNGTIYIDLDGKNGYTSADDIKLGTIATSYSGSANAINLNVINGSITGTATAGDKGTIVVKVNRDKETTPVATSQIEVNVPNK
ncbi:S-layer homology domain-containing protein [Sporosarcina sp.]|uniref:S-layer homology domain-containing protein n=1 Tax=Sporosarcina sp. TaxID=49982 RepID=UPI0026191C53|nr:S-layer homology domain-containing protein [Sporosarcina sp.]